MDIVVKAKTNKGTKKKLKKLKLKIVESDNGHSMPRQTSICFVFAFYRRAPRSCFGSTQELGLGRRVGGRTASSPSVCALNLDFTWWCRCGRCTFRRRCPIYCGSLAFCWRGGTLSWWCRWYCTSIGWSWGFCFYRLVVCESSRKRDP